MKQQHWSMVAVAVLAVGAGWFGSRAVQAQTPTNTPLTFSGRLTTTSGAPIPDGDVLISVNLMDMAAGGMARCQSPAATTTPVANGYFRVNLDANCADTLRTYGDLWAEVSIPGTTFPRTKVGQVPFAVEAARANEAAGALEMRIAALERRTLQSGFRAEKQAGAQSIPNDNTPTKINFGAKRFDLVGDEYDATNSVFQPHQPGYYYVTCQLVFEGLPANSGYQRAILAKNGAAGDWVAYTGFVSSLSTSVRTASGVVRLTAADTLECFATLSDSNAAQNVRELSVFEAIRLTD